MKYLKELIMVALIAAGFLLPVLHNIKNIDAIHDELLFGNYALNVLENKNYDCAAWVYVQLLGNRIPVNCCTTYQYSLPSFIVMPFFRLFGISIYTFKLIFIIISCAGLIAMFYALKIHFGKEFAFVTTLLVSISASFVNYSLFTLATDEHLIFIFIIVGILFHALYLDKKRFLYLFLAVVIFGMGLSIKISAFSYYFGLIAAGLIVYRKVIVEKYKEFNRIQLLLLATGFCTGAFLFIYFNIVTGGSTLMLTKYIFSHDLTWGGVNNIDIMQNVKLRAVNFFELLKDGTGFSFHSDTVYSEILFLLFMAGFIFNLCILFIKKNVHAKIIIFIYVFYIVVFITTFFSPGSMQNTHMAVMQPLQQLVLALFICNLYGIACSFKDNRNKKIKIIFKILAASIFVIVVSAKIMILAAYETGIDKKTAGIGGIDNCVQRLMDYVKSNKLYPISTVEENLPQKIIIHSSGDTGPFVFLSQFFTRNEFQNSMDVLMLKNTKTYFVFEENCFILRWRGFSEERLHWLEEYALGKNMNYKYYGSIRSLDGTAIYIVYQLAL